MRVLIVNTSEKTGGAAVAAHRLMEALNNHGVKAKMLVRDKQTDNLSVVGLPKSPLLRWHFLWERFVVFCHLHFSRKHLFEIDIANAGTDITRLPEFKEADIIHLHWINQGMLSLKDIRKILRSGKPVVWTMHDIWPATAICHYTRGCNYYKSQCRRCQLLPGGGGDKDLSSKLWRRKQRLLEEENLFYVTCSRWLEGEARQSALLKGKSITNIPNAIDSRVFRPTDKTAAREQLGLPVDKQVILFVSQRVTDQRKGVSFFIEAVNSLAAADPSWRERVVVAILGGHADEVASQLTVPAFPLGYVSDEKTIVAVYNATDVYVTPSLEDNLPNTIMEAMACGVPSVGFNVGGIPEEIDHKKNGYVAAYRDGRDLARGIEWVLCEADAVELQHQCLRKVAQNYSQSAVALRYVEVYNQALAMKHYKL